MNTFILLSVIAMVVIVSAVPSPGRLLILIQSLKCVQYKFDYWM